MPKQVVVVVVVFFVVLIQKIIFRYSQDLNICYEKQICILLKYKEKYHFSNLYQTLDPTKVKWYSACIRQTVILIYIGCDISKSSGLPDNIQKCKQAERKIVNAVICNMHPKVSFTVVDWVTVTCYMKWLYEMSQLIFILASRVHFCIDRVLTSLGVSCV